MFREPASIELSRSSLTQDVKSKIACPVTILRTASLSMGRITESAGSCQRSMPCVAPPAEYDGGELILSVPSRARLAEEQFTILQRSFDGWLGGNPVLHSNSFSALFRRFALMSSRLLPPVHNSLYARFGPGHSSDVSARWAS